MDSFYFNHIPKTGGTYLISSLLGAGLLNHVNLFYLADSEQVELKDVKDKNFIIGHYGNYINTLRPEVKTFTILRNPLKRTISLYATMYDLYLKNPQDKQSLYDTNSQYIKFLDHKYKNDPVKLLDYWLEDESFLPEVSNNQSSYLVEPRIFHMYYHDTKETTTFKLSENIKNNEINANSIKKALDDMVLVGTLEQMQLFQDNLFNILNKNFKCNLTNPMPNSKENVSDLSKHVYDRLNKNQIKKIELLNSIDFEAWEYAKGLI